MGSQRLIKNIGFYFLSTLSTRILQFLFIPIYSKYIESSDFGYFNLVVSILSLFIPLLYQSIWEGILRFVIDSNEDEYKVFSTTNLYCGGLCIIYILMFAVFNYVFAIEYSGLIFLMGISQVGVCYWQFSARGLQKNRIFATSTIISTITTIILNFVFVMVLKWGLLALLIANTGGNVAMILYLEFNLKILRKTKIVYFDVIKLKVILKYSAPLSINAISWWLISSANNLIIVNKLTVEANGIYSMANRFGSILALVTSVVNMAWLEESFKSYGDKNKDEYFNNVFDIMTRVIFSGIILLIPTTHVIYKFMVFGDYKQGVIITPLIYMSAGFSTFASHLGSGFLARKESNIVFITTIIGGIVSIVGGFVLARQFGLYGVVGTSLIGYIIMLILRIPILSKRMNLKINGKLFMILTAISFVVSFISNMNSESVSFQITIALISLVVLVMINKQLIRGLIKKVYY